MQSLSRHGDFYGFLSQDRLPGSRSQVVIIAFSNLGTIASNDMVMILHLRRLAVTRGCEQQDTAFQPTIWQRLARDAGFVLPPATPSMEAPPL